MPIPRQMTIAEEDLRLKRDDPEFNLLAYMLVQVNDAGRNLNEVAGELGIGRDNLERWLTECGYDYRMTRRIDPMQPVEIG